MKASRAQIERALDKPDRAVRALLLYGPDEAGARALADRLGSAMGADAERIDLDGAVLKDDPARLSDEANAFSMFASARWVRVRGGDEIFTALDALLSGPVSDTPVLILGGDLKKTSAIVKRALDDPAMLAFACYPAEGGDARAMVTALARAEGLRIAPELTPQILAQAGGDQAILRRELIKYALFLDARPDAPKDLSAEVIDQLAADASEGDLGRLVNAVFDGRPPDVATKSALLGEDPVRLIMLLIARVLLLARLRAEVDAGQSVAQVMQTAGRGIFFKEQPIVARQLARWRSDRLATAHARLSAARRAVMAAAAPVVVDAELMAIARAAARMS